MRGYGAAMSQHLQFWAICALLSLNAGLLALVLIQLHAVEAAAPGSPVYCGNRADNPCFVAIVDAPPPPRSGTGRWGLSGVGEGGEADAAARRERYRRMMLGLEPGETPRR